jgi:hypothetical protein
MSRWTIFVLDNTDLKRRVYYLTKGRVRDKLATIRKSPPSTLSDWEWDVHRIECMAVRRELPLLRAYGLILGLRWGIVEGPNRNW